MGGGLVINVKDGEENYSQYSGGIRLLGGFIFKETFICLTFLHKLHISAFAHSSFLLSSPWLMAILY